MNNLLQLLQNAKKSENDYNNYLDNLSVEGNYLNGRDKLIQDNYNKANYRKQLEENLFNQYEQNELNNINNKINKEQNKLLYYLKENNNTKDYLNSLYNDYLNEDKNVLRNEFLNDYKNYFGEDFKDFIYNIIKSGEKPTLDDINRLENFYMDTFNDEPYNELDDESWR